MSCESEWELDRMELYRLHRTHPDWTQRKLADVLNRSVSWVKKWLRRFRETPHASLEMFKSHSRAPKSNPRRIVDRVRHAVLSLRDQLHEHYGRVVGAKTILYHLHHDRQLPTDVYVPHSTRTIWQILKQGGRIASRVRFHHPLERPAALKHWEMDFGQLSDRIEFLTVIDRATSILVNTQTNIHFNAQTALLAVATLLLLNGLPEKLRFDNDPRFVGNWLTDGYPSPLMRFLLCLGVEPDRVAPGKPQHKPFAERSVRTLKHECLWQKKPADFRVAADLLERFQYFYNHQRANQSLACDNRPPYEAFPELPQLSQIPESVDPDAWLEYYHQHLFKRRVDSSGQISVGRHRYYVGYKLAKEVIGVRLDAKGRIFEVLHQGKIMKELEIQGLHTAPMTFQNYLKQMLLEAQTDNL